MLRAYIRFVMVVCLGCVLLPPVVMVCSRLLGSDPIMSRYFLNRLVVAGVLGMGFWFALRLVLARTHQQIEALSREQAGWLESLPPRYVDMAIIASAAVSLFLELAVIRLQGIDFTVFAFYKNFGLLACFAGLGLGYALASREHIPSLFVIPLLGLQMMLTVALGWLGPKGWLRSLRSTPVVEQLNMGYSVVNGWPRYVALYLFLAVVFLLTALAFVPIGQLCGRLMERRSRLRAYGLNLGGSAIGVLLMLVISWQWAPPLVWFALGVGTLIVFQAFSRVTMGVATASSLVVMLLLGWPPSAQRERIYSPYQLVERGTNERGLLMVRSAGLYYQQVHDLSSTSSRRQTDPKTAEIADYYELAYRLSEQGPGRVAIVGAGTGNDVAAALRMGATQVDAIELDPAILELGRSSHPERPYSDPRVRAIVNDARSFFRSTREQYDLIVYGLLDSHSLLSHASSVRLDSFVYTVEGIREARARLTDGGTLALSFCVLSEELGRKIYLMMQEAFDGQPPVCIYARYNGARVFVERKTGAAAVPAAVLAATGFSEVTSQYSNPAVVTDISTDDWPFFYMPRRVYPVSYLGMGALILLLSVALAGGMTREVPHRSNTTFFFLGAGFMLVETKAITELGLTFGNTWQVIGIVIVGILVMAFLANGAVQWLGLRRPTGPFLLLLSSLAGGLAIARMGGAGGGLGGQILNVVVMTCPLFFAGLVFSTLLGSARAISNVMAVNLLGAMVGGLLEYNSMYFGFQFLYCLAMVVYGMALLTAYLLPVSTRSAQRAELSDTRVMSLSSPATA